MTTTVTPKFAVGDDVHHRLMPYRGEIAEVLPGATEPAYRVIWRADGTETILRAADIRPVTIHLQAVGNVPGVRASRLVPGDVLMWNYGMTYLVTEVHGVSEHFVEITEAPCDRRDDPPRPRGEATTRRLRKDRLVARVGMA
jgi:hypothetical protein